jgi:hypothetical protein
MSAASAPSCTASSLGAGEPPIGSAPHATAWLCLEQDGPWGRTAFTTSHLDADLGARIEERAGAAGVRPALIRRPGHHADLPRGGRQLILASTHPERMWMLSAQITDPEVVLEIDMDALARGDLPGTHASLPALAPDAEPVLLVCTNGARDVCCARLGRPVAVAAAEARPDRVWEVTHTSGHRFAPTAVCLPSGYLHGRVLDASILLDDADAGRLTLTGLRGRSTWPPGGQVAEDAVRHEVTDADAAALVVEPDGEDRWLVRHRDGRRWSVAVTGFTEGESLDSCGKSPTPVRRWRVVTLVLVTVGGGPADGSAGTSPIVGA